MPAPAVLAALAGAPLYLAPFLAGLSAAPAALIPLFAAVWTIWLMLSRPAHWRRRARAGAGLGGLALIVLAHLLLIVAIFATGRGLAVLAGAALALPGWVAVALSLLSLPLARLLAGRAAPKLDAAADPADQGVSAGGGA